MTGSWSLARAAVVGPASGSASDLRVEVDALAGVEDGRRCSRTAGSRRR